MAEGMPVPGDGDRRLLEDRSEQNITDEIADIADSLAGDPVRVRCATVNITLLFAYLELLVDDQAKRRYDSPENNPPEKISLTWRSDAVNPVANLCELMGEEDLSKLLRWLGVTAADRTISFNTTKALDQSRFAAFNLRVSQQAPDLERERDMTAEMMELADRISQNPDQAERVAELLTDLFFNEEMSDVPMYSTVGSSGVQKILNELKEVVGEEDLIKICQWFGLGLVIGSATIQKKGDKFPVEVERYVLTVTVLNELSREIGLDPTKFASFNLKLRRWLEQDLNEAA